MPKLLVTTKLPEQGLEILRRNFEVTSLPQAPKEEIIKIIPDHEVLLVRSETQVDQDIIQAGKNLKIIGRAGTGVDNIDLNAARSANIKVMNTPNANSVAVAELVFGMILSLNRNLIAADNSTKNGNWEKSKFIGTELSGKTLGIIGLGKIGRIVANIGKAFDMNVIGFDSFLSQEQFVAIGIENSNDLQNLLAKSDIITLHIPKTPETTNLIDTKELEQMKKTGIIINCSRGGIINENALMQALKNGTIKGAGIDTWDNEPAFNKELAALPNVVALPHLGASTYEAQEKCVTDLINQIFEFYGYK